jgi:chromosome segregation ATPase
MQKDAETNNQDTPLGEESPPSEPSAATTAPEPILVTTPAKSSWLRRTMVWVLVVSGALLAGILVTYFVLYQPANSALAQTRAEVSTLSRELDQTRSDLERSESGLETSQGDLEGVRFNLALAKVETNVAYARLALATRDLLTARQELSAADANLAALVELLPDEETGEALQERLTEIRGDLSTDSVSASEQLRVLGENLARLETP